MNIGMAIKKAREELGFSQEKLSDKTGLSQTSISQIENGITAPSRKTIEKISKALKLPEDVLYILGIEDINAEKDKKPIFDQLYPKIRELAEQLLHERKSKMKVN